MYCSNCGKQIPDNTIYCSECGHKIGEPSYKSDDKVSINNGSSQAGSVQWGSFIDNNFGFLVKKIRAVGGSNLLMIFVIVALLLVSMFVFSMCLCVCVCQLLSHVQLFVTAWTAAHQAPLSMEFSRQEYQSGWSCPSSDFLKINYLILIGI